VISLKDEVDREVYYLSSTYLLDVHSSPFNSPEISCAFSLSRFTLEIIGRDSRSGFFGRASGVKFGPRNLDRVPCNKIGRYIALDTCIDG
jgi:hypothetical protein